MATERRLRARDIKEAAHGRWDLVFDTLAPELELAMKRAPRHVPNPKTGQGIDGFRLYRNWRETGGGVINTHDGVSEKYATASGSFSDGLAVLGWLHPDKSFQEILEAVHTALGGNLRPLEITPEERARRQAEAAKAQEERAQRDAHKKERLNRIWTESVELTAPGGATGLQYLQRRGIRLREWPGVVRVHSGLEYYDEEHDKVLGVYPGLVTLLCTPDGKPGTLHRTYLDAATLGKAPVDAPKKLAPYPSYLDISGGAMPLYGNNGSGILHIGEGIETSLAVRCGLRESEPVWAAGTASLLGSFTPPAWVRRLVIWGDLDRSVGGERAADILAARLAEGGIPVFTALPGDEPLTERKSYDWLDVLNDYGPDAIMDTYRSMFR